MVTSRSSAGAAFRGEAATPWTVPVKNTFINFDVPFPSVGARVRANSCPPSPSHAECVGHDAAIQELSHAMAPRYSKAGHPEVVIRSGRRAHRDKESATKSGVRHAQQRTDVDCISEVSTNVSEGGSPDTPNSNVGATSPTAAMHKVMPQPQPQPSSQWTSVSTRKKTKTRVANQPLAHVPQEGSPVKMPSAVPAPLAPSPKHKQQAEGRQESSYSRKYDGKGKGLSNFQRIEVGIEDDRDFRVVQRLIGPKGRHMQDIVTEAKGAKVWIIGRGSRSWEDDEGPLMVCVGAMSSSVFDVAVGLVRELLAKVRKEYQKFHRG